MRRSLPAAALSLLAVTALASCASGGAPGTAPGAGAAADTTLKMAYLGGISVPDPDTAYDGQELNLVNSAYQGLLGYTTGDASAELVGVLATDWTANESNTEFTLTLREGVTFHDGTPFTAEAVAASFQRRAEVDRGPAYMVAGATVEALSDYEVKITLEWPNDSFLDLLASPFGPKMISPAAIEEHPVVADEEEDWFDTHSAGTGPYEYGSFEPGVSYQLTAFDEYWGDAPGYEEVTFDVMADFGSMQLAVENGEIDGFISVGNPTAYEAMSQNEDLATYAWESMQTATMFVNPQSAELGDDATRLALLSGIDFEALATDSLGALGEPTTEVFPEHLIDSSLNQQVIEHDAAALEALAPELEGQTISIAYPSSTVEAQALSDNLAAQLNGAGIAAESIGLGQGTFYPEVAKGADAPDIALFNGYPDTAHPDAWAFVFYTPDGGLDLFGADVPGVADDLSAALETGDEELYGQVAQSVSASGYWYSVAKQLGTAVFSADVQGVDGAWAPVVSSVIDLAQLSPAE